MKPSLGYGQSTSRHVPLRQDGTGSSVLDTTNQSLPMSDECYRNSALASALELGDAGAPGESQCPVKPEGTGESRGPGESRGHAGTLGKVFTSHAVRMR